MKRKIIANPSCHLCGSFPEDVKHALWDCEALKIVWVRTLVDLRFQGSKWNLPIFNGMAHYLCSTGAFRDSDAGTGTGAGFGNF